MFGESPLNCCKPEENKTFPVVKGESPYQNKVYTQTERVGVSESVVVIGLQIRHVLGVRTFGYIVS